MDIRIANPGTTSEMPFNVSGMEPGGTATRYITVVNDGSIDMKWRAYISGGDGGALFGALKVKKVTLHPSDYPAAGYTAITSAGYTIAGPSGLTIITDTPFSSLLNPDSTPLIWQPPDAAFAPKWAATYKVEVEMDPAAGDGYQGTSWSGNLTFYGTQYTNSSW